MSAILLENNGRASSRNITRYINIRYFLITDRVNSKEASIENCTTKEIISDLFTKLLQGSKFSKSRNIMINMEEWVGSSA